MLEMPARVIVVDNGSGDGSADTARRRAGRRADRQRVQPRLRRRQQRRHRAVARRRASSSSGCSTTTPWSSRRRSRELLAVADADPRVGAVGSVLYDMAAPRPRADVGRRRARPVDRPHPGRPRRRRSGRLPHRRVACCCGRSALRQVGLFDTRYFFTWEDVDLCTRLVAGGWRLAVAEPVAGLASLGRHARAAGPAAPGGARRRTRGVHAQPLARAVADDAADARLLRGHGGAPASTRAVDRGVAGLAERAGDGDSDRRPELERRRSPRSVRSLARRPGSTTTSRSSSSTTDPSTTRWPCSTRSLAEIAPVPLTVLRNDVNLGFAGGVNRGIRHALDSGATRHRPVQQRRRRRRRVAVVAGGRARRRPRRGDRHRPPADARRTDRSTARATSTRCGGWRSRATAISRPSPCGSRARCSRPAAERACSVPPCSPTSVCSTRSSSPTSRTSTSASAPGSPDTASATAPTPSPITTRGRRAARCRGSPPGSSSATCRCCW